MARPSTVRRVHAAVMALAERGGPAALSMEGIAAQAGVGKQTLYRSWPSAHAILFDALVAESADADESFDGASVVEVLQATIDEITTEPRGTLLRTLAAAIQVDEAVAREFRTRLFEPQREQIIRFLAASGYANPRQAAESLLAPIFYRWFLRLPPFTRDELHEHVEAVRRGERAS